MHVLLTQNHTTNLCTSSLNFLFFSPCLCCQLSKQNTTLIHNFTNFSFFKATFISTPPSMIRAPSRYPILNGLGNITKDNMSENPFRTVVVVTVATAPNCLTSAIIKFSPITPTIPKPSIRIATLRSCGAHTTQRKTGPTDPKTTHTINDATQPNIFVHIMFSKMLILGKLLNRCSW